MQPNARSRMTHAFWRFGRSRDQLMTPSNEIPIPLINRLMRAHYPQRSASWHCPGSNQSRRDAAFWLGVAVHLASRLGDYEREDCGLARRRGIEQRDRGFLIGERLDGRGAELVGRDNDLKDESCSSDKFRRLGPLEPSSISIGHELGFGRTCERMPGPAARVQTRLHLAGHAARRYVQLILVRPDAPNV